MCNVLLSSCEDGVCRLWSETLLPEDTLLGGQISENTHTFSSTQPGNKDKIQHALEVQYGVVPTDIPPPLRSLEIT